MVTEYWALKAIYVSGNLWFTGFTWKGPIEYLCFLATRVHKILSLMRRPTATDYFRYDPMSAQLASTFTRKSRTGRDAIVTCPSY